MLAGALRKRRLMGSPRVLVLGGGVGGTFAANRLARRVPKADVLVVDAHGDHQFQPGIVHVPFGAPVEPLIRDERSLLRDRVGLMVARAAGVDPDRRKVRLETGAELDYDWLILAAGSKVDFSSFPGGKEATHHFHCRRAASRLQEALNGFQGGRIVVGAAGLPYKCPPSVPEFAFLLDGWLRRRGIREATSLTYVYPGDDVLSGAAAGMVRPMLEDRGFEVVTGFAAPAADPVRRTLTSGGRTIGYDLAILAPPHSGLPFVRSLSSGPHGWIHVDPATLKAAERLYVIGDAADLSCPKSGAAAHFQAVIAADNVADEISGRGPGARYDGRGICFMETGAHRASMFESTYRRPAAPASPTRWTWLRKALFSRLYFRLLRSA